MATTETLSSAARSELRGITGEIIGPEDSGYDEARKVHNGMIDRSPGVVIRAASADDVAAGIGFARSHDVPLAIRGGGHSAPGLGTIDDGVVIDLAPLSAVNVDAAGRTVAVGGGATLTQVDAATAEVGMATPLGILGTTGVGGLTLGGGIGHLARKHGLTIDNLLGADVVLADGSKVTASPDENADLFWALRGGGGNFGIVTAAYLQLHPIGPLVYGGMLAWPAFMAGEVVRFWREFMTSAPDEVGAALAFITAPPADFVPEPVRGHPVVGCIACYAGDVDEGEKVMAPLREFGPPGLDLFGRANRRATRSLGDGVATAEHG